MIKNGNFILLLTSSRQEWQFQHFYWHLVVNNGNLTYLLTSSQLIEWNFSAFLLTSKGRCSTMARVSDIAVWHLVDVQSTLCYGIFTFQLKFTQGNNVNFTLLMTSSDQEWQFHISTDISGQMDFSYCYWHLVVNKANLTFLLTSSQQ